MIGSSAQATQEHERLLEVERRARTNAEALEVTDRRARGASAAVADATSEAIRQQDLEASRQA
eukprot:15475249-Alexandrium_andersonii.AAC.1